MGGGRKQKTELYNKRIVAGVIPRGGEAGKIQPWGWSSIGMGCLEEGSGISILGDIKNWAMYWKTWSNWISLEWLMTFVSSFQQPLFYASVAFLCFSFFNQKKKQTLKPPQQWGWLVIAWLQCFLTSLHNGICLWRFVWLLSCVACSDTRLPLLVAFPFVCPFCFSTSVLFWSW